MLQKPAILYVEKITCTKTTGEAGDDDICLKITVDGVTSYYPSSTSSYKFYKDGGTQYVDIAINVTYANEVVFELIEKDKENIDSDKNEWIGSHTLTRSSANSSSGSQTVDMDANGPTSGEYTLTYRIISDPIPTLRVLGIRCEQQSAGMNVDLVEAIAEVASMATEDAAKVIGKSPRPRAKAIAKGFEAASKVLDAVSMIGEWIGRIIEGVFDEVYMDHVESTRGVGGAFFPPGSDYEKMRSGDDIYFEEKYGHYFRFPLDRGPVTLQFREHDGGKADVNIGTLTIAPDSLDYGSGAGVSGTTVNGGVAVMDGPAVVELANSYGGRGGEGALYHMCYSIGFEDWCKPATADGQGDPNDDVGVRPEPGKNYKIIAKHSGKVLNVESASQENGANVTQRDFKASAEQYFSLRQIGGYYAIVAKHSGKVLHVDSGSTTEGASILQWTYVQSNQQLFSLRDVGNGYYSLIVKHTGKAVHVDSGSTTEGANVVQWTYVQSDQQCFKFVPV